MKQTITVFVLVCMLGCSTPVPKEALLDSDGIAMLNELGPPFTGTAVTYHGNGKVKEKRTYKNGKINGQYLSFHENGQLHMRGSKDENNKWEDGLVEQYHGNGALLVKGIIKDSNWADGTYLSYFDDGNLWVEETYKNGVLQGPSVKYFRNGRIASEVTYVNGELDGEVTTYFPFGEVWRRELYSQGELIHSQYVGE